ncbi:hypothetical protein LTR56_012691 [Elasticomyces elasticus]|nr:hypothetical protein LTR56_012691 [Elasticomyces elasticus]KAK3668252.1 hypothetical protein LTR22_000937 [Elasticomyces elasticus]KAK4922743.1 hypothetical protein LTR49_009931 [Elasticomyces elasticus]KAK5769423.1 hypothetical protein LTS12_000350 [Elasticomyces elasticus]
MEYIGKACKTIAREKDAIDDPTPYQTIQLRNSCPSPLAGKKIVVAGAGIAGLAFVISIKTIWQREMGVCPDIILYERETGILGRDGYSLSIRNDETSAGLRPLQEMQILDAIRENSITRKHVGRARHGLWSSNWRRLVEVRDTVTSEKLPIERMRIPRTKLRRVLLDAAEKHVQIIWGVACTSVLDSSDGTVRIQLSNGHEDTCDFLVAADGANSKLRSSTRPSDGLTFAGPVSISAVSRYKGSPPDPVDRDWGIIPSGQGVALFVAPMDEQSAHWSLSYIAEAPRKELRQPMSLIESKRLLKEARVLGAGLHERFLNLVDKSDPATVMVINAMDKQPFAHNARNGVPPGVVFIGDSNHAVSPFAGHGANLALKDGYDLADCFCIASSVEEAVKQYDGRSMSRASYSVAKSHECITMAHSSGFTWAFYRLKLLLISVVVYGSRLSMQLLRASWE